jgi:catechol 2,3-dioxygenase-like lactoylglutathione lyase family enzyme
MIDAPTRATIIAAEPQLYVTDIAAAVDFYVRRMGFALAFMHGEPAFYAQVMRDSARINLRATDGPIGFRADEPDALSATLTVDDAAALFREFEQAGATFHQALRTEPWGARTFIVADPDGNLLCFSGGGTPTMLLGQ